jgi:hypothetical protein
MAENMGNVNPHFRDLKNIGSVPWDSLLIFKNYYTFTFLRNPFDRFISCYFDKVKGQPRDQKYKPLYCPDMTIPDFINYVITTPDHLLDYHVKPQSWYIDKASCYSQIDFIGTLDNYNRDIERVKDATGMTGENKILRPTKHGKAEEYLNNRQIEQLKKRYKGDFELYEQYRR